MKHEWRKEEKALYLPGKKPVQVKVPNFSYFTVEGAGNPNDDAFGEYIGVLYSLSYAVKMSPKAGIVPEGYENYTVYPLEGVWDLTDEARNNYDGKIDKDQLVFKLMIRQPKFVLKKFVTEIVKRTKEKKPHELLDEVKFEKIKDGRCVQMMHVGSYDSEPESFKLMEEFCDAEGLVRSSKKHREIYISNPERTAPEKMKTVLRFQVERNS